MEKIKDLKLMQKEFNLYLANYFSDLKRQVDLEYQPKLLLSEENSENKVKYTEIINKIETIEQDLYKQNQKDEKKIFPNKSIMFIKDYTITYCLDERFYGDEYKYEFTYTFLLIINDEYISQSNVFKANKNDDDTFNRNNLIAYYLKDKLNLSTITNVFEINLDLSKQLEIKRRVLNIKQIEPNTFNHMIHLECIDFECNDITELHEQTFQSLINLKEIQFWGNKIEQLNENLFNGLVKIKIINFSNNLINQIYPATFDGLTSLELINLSNNKLEEIDEHLFYGLTSLNTIDFNSNQIKQIYPATFNGLTTLFDVNFSSNLLQDIDSVQFDGLISLKWIKLENNKLKEISAKLTAIPDLNIIW